jgi:transcriptional regulator with XRE-family HTH domain
MNRLKELRKEHRLSLRDLADRIMISYSALSNAENGKRNLTDIDIKILTEFFNVSSDYLLGLSDIRNAQITKNPTNLDGVEIEILNEVKDLEQKDKDDLLKIIKILKIKGEL